MHKPGDIGMKKLVAIISTTASFLAFASPAFATVINVSPPQDNTITNIGGLISGGFNMAVIFAILFVFAMLIWGGYGWLTAGGDKAKVEEARTRITNAIIGLAIVAASWALINIVSQFFFGEEFGEFNIQSVSDYN